MGTTLVVRTIKDNARWSLLCLNESTQRWGFLDCVITRDEKWILYATLKGPTLCLSPGDKLSVLKRNLATKYC